MLKNETLFKSYIPPGITIINGVTYVVPGYHKVPDGTTLEEVNSRWIREEAPLKSQISPDHRVSEVVISKRTGEYYDVVFNGAYWSCTCAGYDFRGRCKHILQVKNKYAKNI